MQQYATFIFMHTIGLVSAIIFDHMEDSRDFSLHDTLPNIHYISFFLTTSNRHHLSLNQSTFRVSTHTGCYATNHLTSLVSMQHINWRHSCLCNISTDVTFVYAAYHQTSEGPPTLAPGNITAGEGSKLGDLSITWTVSALCSHS